MISHIHIANAHTEYRSFFATSIVEYKSNENYLLCLFSKNNLSNRRYSSSEIQNIIYNLIGIKVDVNKRLMSYSFAEIITLSNDDKIAYTAAVSNCSKVYAAIDHKFIGKNFTKCNLFNIHGIKPIAMYDLNYKMVLSSYNNMFDKFYLVFEEL